METNFKGSGGVSNESRDKFIYEQQNYGTTTDIYMLPVGTTFTVNNGGWSGKIIEDVDGDKCVYVNYTKKSFKLSPDMDYGMVLYNIEKPKEN